MSVITATSYEMETLWKVSVRADSITSVTLDGKNLTYKFSKGICTFDVPKTVKERTVVINKTKVMKFDPLENLTDKRGFLDKDKVNKLQNNNGNSNTPGTVDVPKGDVLLENFDVSPYVSFMPGRYGYVPGKSEKGFDITINDLIPFDSHRLDYKIYNLNNGEQYDRKFWIAQWEVEGSSDINHSEVDTTDSSVEIFVPFLGDRTNEITGDFNFRILIKLQRPLNSVINQLQYKDEDYEKTYYADFEVNI